MSILGTELTKWLLENMEKYPATYTDANGSEHTTIRNDGTTLRMTIRGVRFEGTDFDSFEPLVDPNHADLTQFTLNRNELCSCQIECQIPIPIMNHDVEMEGVLSIQLDLGNPTEHGGLDTEELRITLEHQHQRVSSSGKRGWFEDELLDIQRQFPQNVYMKACMTCMFSDYSPAGHGLFGCMLCFRNIKEQYLTVRSKHDFWRIHDRYDRSVQETFLCSEFQRRRPGIGYRG